MSNELHSLTCKQSQSIAVGSDVSPACSWVCSSRISLPSYMHAYRYRPGLANQILPHLLFYHALHQWVSGCRPINYNSKNQKAFCGNNGPYLSSNNLLEDR